MSNNNSPRPHMLTEWRRGFCELVAGKPFYICPDKPDHPYRVGELVVFDEHSRGVLTGYRATFRIDWTARSTDSRGAYEALIRDGVVILGLTLLDIARPSSPMSPDHSLFGLWPSGTATSRLPS